METHCKWVEIWWGREVQRLGRILHTTHSYTHTQHLYDCVIPLTDTDTCRNPFYISHTHLWVYTDTHTHTRMHTYWHADISHTLTFCQSPAKCTYRNYRKTHINNHFKLEMHILTSSNVECLRMLWWAGHLYVGQLYGNRVKVRGIGHIIQLFICRVWRHCHQKLVTLSVAEYIKELWRMCHC